MDASAHATSTAALVVGAICIISSSLGCRPDYSADNNYLYIRDTLGGIIVDRMDKTGHIPESFESALNDSGKELTHRGDLYGGALWYHACGDDCFFFISGGPDGNIEMGKGDDLVVAWKSGTWFIADTDFVERQLKRELDGEQEMGKKSRATPP